MMKKAWVIPFLLLCIFGAAVFLPACDGACFVGSRETSSNSCRLDIARMTGTDCFTMELSAGDTLAVQFETAKGFLYMEIKAPDGTLLYAGNGKDPTEFTVNISESGTYSVRVQARGAKGTIHIQQEIALK